MCATSAAGCEASLFASVYHFSEFLKRGRVFVTVKVVFLNLWTTEDLIYTSARHRDRGPSLQLRRRQILFSHVFSPAATRFASRRSLSPQSWASPTMRALSSLCLSPWCLELDAPLRSDPLCHVRVRYAIHATYMTTRTDTDLSQETGNRSSLLVLD